MANIKSAKKRIVQNIKRAEINKLRKSKIRSGIKKIHSLSSDKKKMKLANNLLLSSLNYLKLYLRAFLKKILHQGLFHDCLRKLSYQINFFFPLLIRNFLLVNL